MSQVGHNKPPSDADLIREELASACFTMTTRAEELRASFARAPEAICEEAEAHGAILLTAQISALLTKAEEERKSRKEPILGHATTLDDFFKQLVDGLEDHKKALLSRIADYQTAIAKDDDDKVQVRTDEGPLATSSVKVSIVVEDRKAVPARFWRQELDEKAILVAVKDGEIVPGVRRVASRTTTIK